MRFGPHIALKDIIGAMVDALHCRCYLSNKRLSLFFLMELKLPAESYRELRRLK
jgi:hypothetical protein